MKTAKRVLKKNRKRGSSMVEVIVAFLIVTITVVGFIRVVAASSQLLHKSREVIAQTEKFDSEFYKTDSARTLVSGTLRIVVSDRVSLDLGKGTVKKASFAEMSRYTIEVLSDEAVGQ